MIKKLSFLLVITICFFSTSFSQGIPISHGATVTNTTCGSGGGSIVLNTSGGIAPYSYLWSPSGAVTSSIGFLYSGYYSVTITDAISTSALFTFAVNDIGGATLTTFSTNPSNVGTCDGSGSVSAAGATPPYSYLWTNGATTPNVNALCAGIYNLRVGDNNGCLTFATYKLDDCVNFSINASSNASICLGETTTLTSSGAATYKWQPAFYLSSTNTANVIATPIATGIYNYSVTGTSATCSKTKGVSVSVMAAPILTVSGMFYACSGSSTSLTASASSGGANTFVWSPSTGLSNTNTALVTATPASTQSYTIIGTDANSCHDTLSINVLVLPNPSVTISGSAIICLGTSTALTASAGSGGGVTMDYTWNPSTGLSSNTGPAVIAKPITNTTYTATAINGYGCKGSSQTTISVEPAEITGQVFYSGGNIDGNGETFAKLFRYAVNKEMEQRDSVGLDASGGYIFGGLSTQDTFIVFVKADTSFYHNTIGTYYSNTFEWGEATPLPPECPFVSANITLIETTVETGSGKISGKVLEGEGFGKTEAAGDGIEGVQVGLKKKPGGKLSMTATTDSAGDYNFDNVPDGDYTIYIDIPGLPVVTSYTVSITPANPTYSDANFEADSNKVEAISANSLKEFKRNTFFSVFPNPAGSEVSVAFGTLENRKIDIINSLGQLVYSISSSDKTIKIDVTSLSSGIYHVRVITNTDISSQLISIVK